LAARSKGHISLPDALKEFVETQVSERGYGNSSEFVRDLIRLGAIMGRDPEVGVVVRLAHEVALCCTLIRKRRVRGPMHSR
jgi:hypothetical protein